MQYTKKTAFTSEQTIHPPKDPQKTHFIVILSAWTWCVLKKFVFHQSTANAVAPSSVYSTVYCRNVCILVFFPVFVLFSFLRCMFEV